MYEVTVTDEFARWFGALDEPAAVRVASVLEVVEAAGPALGPDRASDMLLFYDGTGGGLSSLFAVVADWCQDLVLHRREALRCLESETFRTRLRDVDSKTADKALAAIGRLQSWLVTSRGLPAPTLSTVLWPNPASARTALLEAIRLVGLDPADLSDTSGGLREVTIRDCEPRLHVIYGIDVPNRRVVVLLGEALDRAYYGDSVRWAEERWREYCAQPEARAEAGRAR
jgi:hypothetical protein